jgi:hypothetical protein
MSKQAQFPIDYSRHIAIVQALRTAFDKIKHHQKFSKRIKPAIEAVLPEHTVYVGEDGHFCRVQVCGNGLTYEQRVSLSWVSDTQKGWVAAMAEEIERADLRDYSERQDGEVALLPELAELDRQVRELRAKAKAMIAALPDPKSRHGSEGSVFLVQRVVRALRQVPPTFQR